MKWDRGEQEAREVNRNLIVKCCVCHNDGEGPEGSLSSSSMVNHCTTPQITVITALTRLN